MTPDLGVIIFFAMGWLLGRFLNSPKKTTSISLKMFEQDGKWYVFEKEHGVMVSGKSREEAINKAKQALKRILRSG